MTTLSNCGFIIVLIIIPMCLFYKAHDYSKIDNMTLEQRSQYVQVLIDNSPKVDQDSNTALIRAVIYSNKEVEELLISKFDNMTPKQRAQYVLDLINNPSEIDKDAREALIIAAINSNKEVVDLLFSKLDINDITGTHLKLD